MVSTQNNASTLSTITTVRTSVGVILHMAQVHTALTTLARAAVNLYVVYEITLHLDIVNNLANVCKNAV